MNERDIANKALENLQKTAHIKGRWKPIALNGQDNGLDGQIEFTFEKKSY